MSTEFDTFVSAQERAEVQAKALHHSRRMARLQSEVDAIEGIRTARQRREVSRKRLLAKVGVLGTALFLFGLAAGSFGNGRISINFLDGDSQSVPLARSKLDRPPESPPSASAVVSAGAKPSANANGIEERPAVIVAQDPKVAEAGTSLMPTVETGHKGLAAGPLPMAVSNALPRIQLPSVLSLPGAQPLQPPQPPQPLYPFPRRPSAQIVSAPAAQVNKVPSVRKDAAVPVEVEEFVIRDSKADSQAPMRSSAVVPVAVKSESTLPVQANQGFKVIQYLDKYVLVRVGNSVATFKVGERLPDGRLLKSVSDGSITTE